MPILSGHTLDVLREDERITLLRGYRTADSRPILALTPRYHADEGVLRRFENELALAGDLHPAWAARPINLLRRDSMTALIFDDPGGEPLSQRIGTPFEMSAFLRTAINLADVLRQIHLRGLIHKDIRPANFFIDGEDVVRVTGFGVATRLARERQSAFASSLVKDTLAYMAPEQTGRMNRSIDSRSDLYSVGIIFYQMLTGRLPFAATDVMGWVHCHIAQPPAPPDAHVKVLPKAVVDIVMRLIEKNAEDRYQSAVGLLADLKTCQDSWNTSNQIGRFVLGASDGLDRLLISEKLYGREADVGALADALDRVDRRGTIETVLVTGYSGIGKSSVVSELHKTIVAKRGLFASAKFDQFKREIPYLGLSPLLRGLVVQLLSLSDETLLYWRDSLKDALGQNAQLVVDLVPQLEIIIGQQPDVAELSPQDAQRRFQAVLSRFIGVFARPAHPLTLFFDDLQWVDLATLDFLRHLTTQAGLSSLLVVGAYRDNEAGASHPLTRAIDEMIRAKAAVHRIVLSELIVADVTKMICDALRCTPDRARPLSQLIHARTGGNPFFVIQLLSSLEQEGLLAFAAETSRWEWSVNDIAARRPSENVVNLMLERLARLPAPVQTALTQLACMGNTARVSTLSAIHGQDRAPLDRALWQAARLDFVSLYDDAYSFNHDRIQEAAYSLIPAEERIPTHLQIGRAMSQILTAAELDEQIFDVINHLNIALSLIKSQEELKRVAELNLAAGLRAKGSTAYAIAWRYFAAGSAALLSISPQDQPHHLAFGLELNRAECELLTGLLEEADVRLSNLADQAEDLIERAAVARLRMTLCLVLDRTHEAVAIGLAFLDFVDISWSSRPNDAALGEELANMWNALGTRSIEDLIALPHLEDRELLATVDVLTDFLAPASFTDNNLFQLTVLRIVNISMTHGNCDASACAYALLNSVVGLRGGNYQAGLQFGQLGCDLVDRLGLDRFKARVYTFFGTFVLPWTSHLAQSRAILKRAVHAATAAGDVTYAAYSFRSLAANALVSGDPLSEVHREADKALSFMRDARLGLVADSLVAQLIFVLDVRGQTAGGDLFSSSDQDEVGFQRRLDEGGARLAVAAARYHIYKLQSHFLNGDFSAAATSALKASSLIWSTSQFLEIIDYRFYSALLLAESYEASPPDRHLAILAEIGTHRQEMESWSYGCRENHAHRLALLSAEIARITDSDSAAMRHYDQAMQLAEQYGFIQGEGLAAELAAKFYRSRGAVKAAGQYLSHAIDCYRRWGASAKVQQLTALTPLHHRRSDFPPAAADWEHLDIAAMIKTSQAISEEIVIDRLIERLMTIAVEHAGADRAILVLSTEAGLRLEAEAATDNGSITVQLRRTRMSSADLCEPVLRYVVRTNESIVLDDASAQGSYTDDDYIRVHQIRSLNCLPLLKQSTLIGVLYLENRLASHVFTPERVTLLRTLASQAAISLENARLYSELKTAEMRLQASHDELQMFVSLIENSTDFIGYLPASGRDGYINAGGRRMVGIAPDADVSQVQISDLRPSGEDRKYSEEILPVLMRDGRWTGERNLRHFQTNATIPVLQNLFFIIDNSTGERKGIASICKDISSQREADEAIRKARADLERVAQRMTMGEFASSMAHELNQPLMAVVTSAETCLLRLDRQPPDVEKARAAAERVVKNGHRASDVIKSVRSLLKGSPPETTPFDATRAINDVLDLARSRINEERIALEIGLNGAIFVVGDRGQFQQVVLNLVTNAIEAMSDVVGRSRRLGIRTHQDLSGFVTIEVTDSGTGIAADAADQIFTTFFSTKSEGMGMGLSICRSIVELHNGRLWATPNLPHGTVFSFSIPAAGKASLNSH